MHSIYKNSLCGEFFDDQEETHCGLFHICGSSRLPRIHIVEESSAPPLSGLLHINEIIQGNAPRVAAASSDGDVING